MGDAALVGRSDLAVDDEGSSEFCQAVERGVESIGAVEPVAREQAQAAHSVSDGSEAVAVVLHLVDPSLSGRWLWAGGSELERDGQRERCRARSGGQAILLHCGYRAEIGAPRGAVEAGSSVGS